MGDALSPEGLIEDLDRLAQALDAPRAVQEVDADELVLLRVVPGPHADVEPSLGDLIDGQGLLRQHGRVARGGVRDEGAEANALRVGGECGERRPRLEDQHVRRARNREVVGDPADLEPE
jgi:hypothetical protein